MCLSQALAYSEVIVEATPLNKGLSGCGLSLTARGHRAREGSTLNKRQSTIQDCTRATVKVVVKKT